MATHTLTTINAVIQCWANSMGAYAPQFTGAYAADSFVDVNGLSRCNAFGFADDAVIPVGSVITSVALNVTHSESIADQFQPTCGYGYDTTDDTAAGSNSSSFDGHAFASPGVTPVTWVRTWFTDPQTTLAWVRADIFNGFFSIFAGYNGAPGGPGTYSLPAATITLTIDYTPPAPTPTWWFWDTPPFIDGIDIGPFYWYGTAPPPFPGWDDEDAVPPSPDGWFMSTAAYGGSTLVIASAGGGGGALPRPYSPRAWTQFAGFATGSSAWLGGSPGIAAVVNNRMIYAASNYTGTTYPPVRLFDGSFDRELCRLPPTAAAAIPKAIVSILAANGTIYVASWDTGSSSSDWVGRVFSLDITTASFTPIGDALPAGHLPYALAWHNGMLWVGTHRQSSSAAGKIYRIRPGIDPAWTLDADASGGMAGVASLLSWQGSLYAGWTAAAGTFATVWKRAVSGTWGVVDTGSGGAATANNGYLALREFSDALYASYWNPDTPAVAKIRKTTDGTTWTTSYTGASGTLRPFIVLHVDDGELFAIGGDGHLTAAILRTPDGTTWTDLTAEIPETDRTMLPAVGVLVF